MKRPPGSGIRLVVDPGRDRSSGKSGNSLFYNITKYATTPHRASDQQQKINTHTPETNGSQTQFTIRGTFTEEDVGVGF